MQSFVGNKFICDKICFPQQAFKTDELTDLMRADQNEP